MSLGYEIERSVARCHATERDFAPGETFYSTLVPDGAAIRRHNYAPEAWEGPPEGSVGWWKARMPGRNAGKPKLAPNEVLLNLFEEWADDAKRQDSRYVLGLLLVRRRVLRLSETEGLGLVDSDASQAGDTHQAETRQEMLQLDCPSNNKNYEIPVIPPTAERAAVLQDELNELLYAEIA